MNVDGAPEWMPYYLVPFFTLSYPTSRPENPDSFPTSDYYTTGLLDGCIIISSIAVMALLRDVTRVFLLEPFAQWFLTRSRAFEPTRDATPQGVSNGNKHALVIEKSDLVRKKRREERQIRRSVLRFAEQGWSVIYYSILWSYGLYIHTSLPTSPFNPEKVWQGYPHTPVAGPIKLYYLIQTGFYFHQILILHAEARRKDHYQMLLHHIITIVLMILSFIYNFTRVGCLIIVLMDYCDIWLPSAKMLRYLSLPTLFSDLTFTWFLLSWLVTRHVLFILVIKSLYIDAPKFVPFIWAPERGLYFTHGNYLGFVALLVSLQFLQILWFFMICRVAWRVVSGQGAEDTRSDDEDGKSSQEEDTPQTPIPPHADLKKRR